jgi:lysophospholipase L1-like esterase
MQPNYRNVPTTERQSFEIEGAHNGLRHDNERSVRPNPIVAWFRRRSAVVRPPDLAIAIWLIFVFAVMAMVGHARAASSAEAGGVAGRGGRGHHEKAVRVIPAETEQFRPPPPKFVFCYGDSLTHGSPPPETPYSEYLERELNDMYTPPALDSDSSSAPPRSNIGPPKDLLAIVRHLGIPGYTATMMLDHFNDEKTGLCPAIWHNRTMLSLVIILAGSNDIAVMTDTGKDEARSILQKIVDMHNRVFKCHKDKDDGRLRTLAMGIPGSAYQDMVPAVASSAAYINEGLKNFASSNPRISYFDFPFPYRDDDKKWGEDGTHMSEEGYEQLGKALAPQVKEILDSIGSL